MSSILILFHCESNPGFAASSHEHTFLKVALNLVNDYKHVHFAYRTLENGITPNLPEELTNFIELNTRWTDKNKLNAIQDYIKGNNIETIFGFDQPVKAPAYKYLRAAGIKTFVSYWGAPMSSINSGLKLWLKRLEVALSNYGPQHYIFQSEGMRKTAIYGRGIPEEKTSIVKTGIDTERFKPDEKMRDYAHEKFSIDKTRKIIFFSGHMEERKGVHIIIKAAVYLSEILGRDDMHFLILGNKPGQEKKFESIYKNTKAENHITFGGYRSDVAEILKSCSVGMIASTGWDSFPMSSLEIAASELPLLISNLPGLNEAINDKSGLKFPSGDVVAASESLAVLLDNSKKRKLMGREGRNRVLQSYSRDKQAKGIESIIRRFL